MPVIIIDTLARGSSGDSPFPVILEQDAKVSYLTVIDVAVRDAIPEWQRTAGMRVHVITPGGKDYRLGTNVTIAGQVWTEVASSAAFQLISEKNQAGGYVGLELDGFINPAFIKSIYANTSYVVANYTERNALTTLTGDIIVVTDTSETFVKLNNNVPPNVDGDFSLLSVGGAVSSVNGQIGTVIVDFSSMIAQGGSQASFEAAVAAAPSVAGNTSQIILNTNDITAIYAILAGLGAATEVNIPLYNNGITYEDGDNIIYGAEHARNLYRVKAGQGPVFGVLPTDILIWERVGDFYTQDEIDNLMLNIVSNPLLNFNRPIHKLPEVGEIPGSNQLITGIEEIYYGRIDVVSELLSIDAVEIGASIAPTINGKVTRGDALSIQQITILDDIGNPVGNPAFVGTDAIIEFSFQVDTAIAIVENSTLTYRIQVDAVYDILLPAETTTTPTTTISAVYPMLFGDGAENLNAVDKYVVLQHLIEADGNKLLSVNSNSNKLYFCIPEEYADRISILDNAGHELIDSLFPLNPTIEQIDSSALNVNWSHNYKVYQTNYNTDSNAIELNIIIDPEILGINETLDDIAEGIINKHLTASLKEKLANFDGADYLTKAVYDTDDNGIIEKAAARATNAKNETITTIPAQSFVHVVGAVPAEESLSIELADASNNKAASGYVSNAILPGETGIIILEGFTGGYTLVGATVGDIMWLGSAGGALLIEPTSGLLQTVGTVLDVAGNIINLAIGPQDTDDRANFLFNWRPFTPYLKDTHITVDLSEIPSVPSQAIISARIIVDDYTSSNDIIADFNVGAFEIIGGEMLSSVYDPNGIEKDIFDMDSMLDGLTEVDPAVRKVTLTEDERQKLRDLEPSTFKGTFDTANNLRLAFPTALDGDSATVTATGTTWLWNSSLPNNPSPPTTGGDWEDSLIATGGDMKASIYDPAAKSAVIWDVDNHDDGITNKVYTAVEKTKLTGIEANATADQTAGEIKVAYESNADTNAFLDAEKTKLSGIEPAAKDDQNAAEVPYIPLAPLTATDVQAGLDEIKGDNETEKTLVMYKSIYDANDNGIVDQANNIIEIAENTEAVNMNAGDVVYIDSADLTSEKALWSSNNNSATVPITGIVLNDGAITVFAPGATIHIGISGIFKIPTFGGFTAGDSLYLALAGQMQNTPPVVNDTTFLILVAYVSGVVGGDSFIEMLNLSAFKAINTSYNPAGTVLLTTSVQDALNELAARSVRVMGTLSFDSAGGTIETIGEIALPTTLSAYSPNISSPAAGRLAVDIDSDVTISISVGAETIGNSDDAQIELAVNGVLQGIRSNIATGGNQSTGAGMTITHTLQLTAGDYISAFLQVNSVVVYGVQITITGNQT